MQSRKPSGISGQAVIEGVMIKTESMYAIAVRRADQSIDIKKETYQNILERFVFFQIPLIRGIVTLIEIFYFGVKTFLYSASFYEEEEMKRKQEWEEWISTGTGKNFTKDFKKNKTMGGLTKKISSLFSKIKIAFLMICFLVISVALIFLVPIILSEQLIGPELFIEKIWLEEVFRILIFFLSFLLLSRIEDIRRMFMYHGAEHKVIHCIENGQELTLENVRQQLRQYKNCETSFFFSVIFFSILSFALIQTEVLWKKILFLFLLTFVIAAVVYEWIHLTKILSKPILWFQNLFTKEPEDDMILVAIQSVEAVFDWREFLQENWGNHIEWKPLEENKEENKPFSMLAKERLQQTISNETDEDTVEKQEEQEIEEGTYARLQPDIENEDDPILKALDKFFGE